MKKTSIKLAALFFVFSLIFLVSLAFAQGKEFSRVRAGTLSADQEPLAGTEAQVVQYFIASSDEIEVFVWQNPDLSKTVIVGPDGKISYPLIGRIQAAGLSIEQLEQKLTTELAKYVKSPYVSLTMKKFSGNKIIVLGEVNYPGIYTYQGSIDLVEAIGLAGDFNDMAHLESVIVVHGNLTDKPEARRINMKIPITRGTKSADIILSPNDVVFVPKTFIANLNKSMTDINMIVNNANTALQVRQEIRRMTGYRR